SPLISNYFQHSVVYWEIGSFTKLGLWVSGCGFAFGRAFSTKLYLKHHISNIAKSIKQSTRRA
ncbi:MAG: hypothetical protein NWQ39_09355, partial [Saprospiraceae bacterium]|nr:hypothetical protein [Saprospiraceae bacterium]